MKFDIVDGNAMYLRFRFSERAKDLASALLDPVS
jgi:hypothetical protein